MVTGTGEKVSRLTIGRAARAANRRGFSLPEMLIVVAILGLIATTVPGLISLSVRFYQRYNMDVILQQQARSITEVLMRFLNDAKASSVVLDQINSPQQPPYSRITFTMVNGAWVQFYQQGSEIYESIQMPSAMNPSTTVLTRNAYSLQFNYPRTDNPTLIDIKVTLRGTANVATSQTLEFKMNQVHMMNL